MEGNVYSIFRDLAIIIVAAKICGIAAAKLKAPQVVGEIVAGLLIGPSLFGLVKESVFLLDMAEIGVVLLMFFAGLETNLKDLKKTGVKALVIACAGVFVPLIGGALLYFLYYGAAPFGSDKFYTGVFTGVIMTATSVSITVATLQELGKLKDSLGTTIMSAAIIDDVIGIIVLTLVIGFKTPDVSPMKVVTNTVLFFLFALVMGVGGYHLFRILDDRYPHTRRIPIFGLVLCLALAYIAETYFGIADITGAYVAGIILCNIRDSEYIARKIDISSYMFFAPVFFASIGIKTSLQSMNSSLLIFSLLFVAVALLGKIIGCGGVARLMGMKGKDVWKVGVGMMTRGEVALIVMQKGIDVGMISPMYSTSVILLIVISSILTPIILKLLYAEKLPLKKQEDIMKKVVKFGGSSLASAEQFKKVGDIIRADEGRRYVVPSAPGKRYSDDIKVTDMLYDCYHAAEAGEDFSKKMKRIQARYQEIIDGLGLSLSLEPDFEVIAEDFKNQAGSDYAASRGEYLNGKIMAAYLGYEFLDSAKYIFFDDEGNLDAERTDKCLGEKLKDIERAVIPGFYGAHYDGTVKTFSRGGSDVTGSIVARAVCADLYENWTDVSGFLVTDPRIVDNPEVISTITYKELRELAYMGATVLHEDAIFPLRQEGIPVNIRNTNRPLDKGTMIVESTCNKPKYTITGIAGTKGFASINIEKDMMNSEVGFGRKVLQVFEENGLSFEHVPSGIDTFTVYVHQDEFEEKEQNVIAGLHRAVQPDSIDLESDLALIAVVGRGMRRNRGTAARIFAALAHSHVNVKMIDQGSSELNIIIGVENRDFETAIRSIYDIFVLSQV